MKNPNKILKNTTFSRVSEHNALFFIFGTENFVSIKFLQFSNGIFLFPKIKEKMEGNREEMEGFREEMEGFREEMEGFGEEMEGIGGSKNTHPYYCSICNINCKKKNNYEIHVKTKKHINNYNLQNNKTESESQSEIINSHKCKECGKIYKTDSGLWKHMQKFHKNANQSEEEEQENEDEMMKPQPNHAITPELMMMLLQQNKEMQQAVIEIVKKIGNTTNNNNSHNTTNIQNNKSFNLNVFLNETCKDAMNMSEFLNRLDVTTYDFEHTGKNGYVQGMCRILENGLNNLEVHERPIHCTDAKRETIYIKDNDKWEKDDEQKTKLTSVIKQVGAKNIKMIPQWCKEHPGWNDADSKENDRYLKYVFNSMCGGTDEEIYKNYGDIARYISRITVVDKKEVIAIL